MRHVFISPHLDDAIFSAGDYLLELKKKKERILLITVFTEFGKGPLSRGAKKYLRWSGFDNLGDFVEERRKEDREAMLKLKVDYRYLGFVDAGFRTCKDNSFLARFLAIFGMGSKFLYPLHSSQSLFSGKIAEADKNLSKKILIKLKKIINKKDIIYGPLAVGKHVDHRIVYEAISYFSNKKYYWLDQPYSSQSKNYRQLKILKQNFKEIFRLKKTAQKIEIVKCYFSQIKDILRGKDKFIKERFFIKKPGRLLGKP